MAAKLSCPKINRPLIPLKMAVFFWFGAGFSLTPFTGIYLKQLGLSLANYSTIYTILPVLQFLGSVLSGMAADKIGRPKPVLLWNLLLVTVMANAMLLIPGLKSTFCNEQSISCHSNRTSDTPGKIYCSIMNAKVAEINCSFQCPTEETPDFCVKNYITVCDLLTQHGISNNINSMGLDTNTTETLLCIQHEAPQTVMTHSSELCNNHLVNNCTSVCEQIGNSTGHEVHCPNEDGKLQLFILSFITLVFYNTFYTNVYRILDFTAVSMAKTHNSHYGRQRLWSIMGIMVFAPLSGLIVTVVSPINGLKRYDVMFYFFDALILLLCIVFWKLDVEIRPSTKNLMKQFVTYANNLDVIVFLAAVLVCGTHWGFNLLFRNWYLEDLGASAFLMGLNRGIVSFLGLPFLFTSHWFVKKIGSFNYIILALFVRSISCIGYSYLTNPWWSVALQPLGVIIYHVYWVAVMVHCETNAPAELGATVITLAGGIQYGLGRGTGSLVGGFIMSKYGGRISYRVMAGMCTVTAILLILYRYLRRRNNVQEELVEPKMEDTTEGGTADILCDQLDAEKRDET